LVATGGLAGYLTSKLRLGRRGSVLALAVVLPATPIALATSNSVAAVALAQSALLLAVGIVGIHAGLLLHDAVPSSIRTGVSSGVGTLSWVLFLPCSIVLGGLIRGHGVHLAGWVLLAVAGLLALMLALPARRESEKSAQAGGTEEDAIGVDAAGPDDVACRELVALVTDYLDGILPADQQDGLDRHLADCDGCTTYLRQIRTTIDVLASLGQYQPDTAGAETAAAPDA
jgi:MFS family permease